MRLVLLVAGQELVVNLRRPAFIILTLLIPALGGLVFVMSSMFRGQVGGVLDSQLVPSHAATGFVDLSGLLIADLPQYGGDFIQYPDEASARAELLAGFDSPALATAWIWLLRTVVPLMLAVTLYFAVLALGPVAKALFS